MIIDISKNQYNDCFDVLFHDSSLSFFQDKTYCMVYDCLLENHFFSQKATARILHVILSDDLLNPDIEWLFLDLDR